MDIKRIRRKLRHLKLRFKMYILHLEVGMYCLECKRYFTFQEYSTLTKERIYPQYIATYTICPCGSKRWKMIG